MKKTNQYLLISVAVVIAISATAWNVADFWCSRCATKGEAKSTEPMKIDVLQVCSEQGVCNKKVFLLSGRIYQDQKGNTIQNLERAAANSPDVKTICLNSIGGDNGAARDISWKISDLGLDTCLATKFLNLDGLPYQAKSITCQSSCTWMMLAGKNRELYSSDIFVGFHGSTQALPAPCEFRTPYPLAFFTWWYFIWGIDNQNDASWTDKFAHLNLLAWSFAQGFGESVSRGVDILVSKDNYVTLDSRQLH